MSCDIKLRSPYRRLDAAAADFLSRHDSSTQRDLRQNKFLQNRFRSALSSCTYQRYHAASAFLISDFETALAGHNPLVATDHGSL